MASPTPSIHDTLSFLLHTLAPHRQFKTIQTILTKILSSQSPHTLFDSLLHSYPICNASPLVFNALFKTLAQLKKPIKKKCHLIENPITSMDKLTPNPANSVPLTPLIFLERAAILYVDSHSILYDHISFTWSQTHYRCLQLASSLTWSSSTLIHSLLFSPLFQNSPTPHHLLITDDGYGDVDVIAAAHAIRAPFEHRRPELMMGTAQLRVGPNNPKLHLRHNNVSQGRVTPLALFKTLTQLRKLHEANSSISDFSVSFNICATSRSQFCIHYGQQIDTASGSTFSEARLNGEIVVVGKGNKILERDHRSWSGNGGGSRLNRSGRKRHAWKAGGFCGEERERGRKKETAAHDFECRGGQRSGGKKP
ncbi:acyl-activating enzyme 9 [Vigna angularis]|uniref:Acyl-activating enzyme 9 n=1 Tax=Phaseolus angularis TaxID=3914 RepID=A0A8T0K2N4_PHAAN|nr:acyl-activating enzyme 9 [Vigna angularis]